METLSIRLEQLAALYHLQIGPLLMVFAAGLAGSPLLAWTAGALIALETLNKLYHVFGKDRRPDEDALAAGLSGRRVGN